MFYFSEEHFDSDLCFYFSEEHFDSDLCFYFSEEQFDRDLCFYFSEEHFDSDLCSSLIKSYNRDNTDTFPCLIGKFIYSRTLKDTCI
jgi:hypothetical protein